LRPRPARSRQPVAAIGSAAVRPPHYHRGRRIAAWFFGVIGLLVVAGAAYGYWFIQSVESDMQPDSREAAEVAQVTVKKEAEKPFTILLIGADNMGEAGDSRADTLILAKVDPEQKRIWMISIPRDTKADIPRHGTAKINKAYQLGGPSLTIETVSELLDVPINHYMETDITGFREVVDALGGVWIDVDVEIDDPKAAAANPGKQGQHIEPGYQLLDGNHALVYVRSRDFPDADFARMRHQQAFFKAIAKQALQAENFLRLPATIRAVAQFTRTDMSVNDMIRAANAFQGMSDEALETATLKGEWRNPYVHTDEEYKEYLLERFNAGVSFEAAIEPPVQTSGGTGLTVDVRNGSTVAGAAAQAADVLRAAGYSVQEVGNAKTRDYETTKIVYNCERAEAEALAALLGMGTLVRNDGTWLIDTDVLVVTGADWARRGD
jgi:LCP family protein required for cell wall assembly